MAACKGAIVPNAVGVDIGCGMCAVQTDWPVAEMSRNQIVQCLKAVRRGVPLDYAALENRARVMAVFKEAVFHTFKGMEFLQEINIHHNHAALEEHFGGRVWVHRKGAISAKDGETGIIPGSKGTHSCIVRGKGNADSFASCSRGAGRTMGRMAASRSLSKEEFDKAMEGIVFSGWHTMRGRGKKGRSMLDLSEAPQAYKDIDEVIEAIAELNGFPGAPSPSSAYSFPCLSVRA